MTTAASNTKSVLIAALGGEGGGVLADWTLTAIRAAGYLAQSTSIPGVAQRTGATTYYIEYSTIPLVELGLRQPVFALTPVPGLVDAMVASELIEAARAAQAGYISPELTTLIASAHRVFATTEKIAMDDGRYNSEAALKVVHALARRAIVFDMEKAAEQVGTVINAVLFGALAGANVLKIDRVHFEHAIRASGKSVDANMRGFELGYSAARGDVPATPMPAKFSVPAAAPASSSKFPVEAQFTIESGFQRCLDYQDRDYADSYMAKVRELVGIDRSLGGADKGWRLTVEGARFLALRMTYEDVIRVADLKTRRARFATVRNETRAKSSEPIYITEYLKPGPEELCALLPKRLGDAFLSSLRKRNLEHRFNIGLYIKSHTITGFLTMRTLANMRFLRRRSWRFAEEEALTSRWFGVVKLAARLDYQFGVQTAECADLVKGYSGTYRRGIRNFNLIFGQIVEPAIAQRRAAAEAVRGARIAALSDPEGEALDKYLDLHVRSMCSDSLAAIA